MKKKSVVMYNEIKDSKEQTKLSNSLSEKVSLWKYKMNYQTYLHSQIS